MACEVKVGGVGNRAPGHRSGLVERVCRKIIENDAGYDRSHVFAGDFEFDTGPGTTSTNILERRACVRSLVSCALFLLALLLWGAMLHGIDAAQEHMQTHESNDNLREQQETTSSGCMYVSDSSAVASRGEM